MPGQCRRETRYFSPTRCASAACTRGLRATSDAQRGRVALEILDARAHRWLAPQRERLDEAELALLLGRARGEPRHRLTRLRGQAGRSALDEIQQRVRALRRQPAKESLAVEELLECGGRHGACASADDAGGQLVVQRRERMVALRQHEDATAREGHELVGVREHRGDAAAIGLLDAAAHV